MYLSSAYYSVDWLSRQPVLTYVDGTHIDIENNFSTSNTSVVEFTDGARHTITENTASTAQFRRITTGTAASLVSPYAGGVRAGETIGTNTWWCAYYVKTQDRPTDTTKAVPVLTQTAPIGSSVATLNGYFGVNSWKYLGSIPNGDGTANGNNAIPVFLQAANFTRLSNRLGLSGGFSTKNIESSGLILANSASAASITYNNAKGFNLGSGQLPSHLNMGLWRADANVGGTVHQLQLCVNASTILPDEKCVGGGADNIPICQGIFDNTQNVKALCDTTATNMNLMLIGWWDSALGIGANPQT